jgi:hypothetical protein
MRSSRIMSCLIGLLVAAWIGLASSPAAKAQTTNPKLAATAAKVTQLLQGSGYTFTTHNAVTWSVDLQRKNVGKVRVIISVGDDIVVVFVILGKKAKINKSLQFLDALALANYTYDYVKICLDKDGDLGVRIDSLSRLMDLAQLKSEIEQVANTSDEWFPQISAYVSR